VLADPDAARADGERAAERARRRFSWDAVTDRYESLFRSLAAGEPPAG
jgi:glycosyltransferase involved in cell wall biosynthesis